MYRFLILLSIVFLLWAPLFSSTDDYLKNIRMDPEHGEINAEGKLDLLFDLPQSDIVETAYLSIQINNEIIRIEGTTITGSNLGYLSNSIPISGATLYDIFLSKKPALQFFRLTEPFAATSDDDTTDDDLLDNDFIYDSDVFPSDNEMVDIETDDFDDIENASDDDTDENSNSKIWADKTYELKLTLEMDTSGESTGTENETDDSDTTSGTTTIPALVERTITIKFDNIPPEIPDSVETESGDERIIFRITPPEVEDGIHDNIGKYYVSLTGIFDNNGVEISTTVEYSTTVPFESSDKTWEFSISDKGDYKLINNDSNNPKYIYKAVVSAEDFAGNYNSDNYLETEAFAITTYGFWSNYEKNGGNDDGKFCFVATAGFGSYFHPYVQILRTFRDNILSKSSAGQKLIDLYYVNGEKLADFIKDSSILKAVSRALLMPFVISAWFITNIVGKIVIFLWIFLFALYLIKKRKTIGTASIFLIILFSSTMLQAINVDGEVNFSNSFYYPKKIDGQVTGTPFKEIGGDSLRYLPYLHFGLKVPLLEKYIRWSFTGGVGYTRMSGTSIKPDGKKSSDKSYMHFIPLTGETKIRPVYSFPVYPYASIGLDYYIWWIREHGKTEEEGGTFGFHGNFGIMISLNWLDASSSRKLEKAAGITNTGLFVHYRLEKITDFGKDSSFDLSSSRFEFGIVFEF